MNDRMTYDVNEATLCLTNTKHTGCKTSVLSSYKLLQAKQRSRAEGVEMFAHETSKGRFVHTAGTVINGQRLLTWVERGHAPSKHACGGEKTELSHLFV